MSEGKVYVIDDDLNALKLMQSVLEKAGFEVRTTNRIIGTTSEINQFAPDVILLDIMMPALSGDRLVEILRKGVQSNPIIIVVSNKSEDELKEIKEKTGIDDYITKLSGPTAMLRKINEQLYKRKRKALDEQGKF